MSLNIAVPRESVEGERRVALDPTMLERLLASHNVSVIIETQCGRGAGFYDDDYADVTIATDFNQLVSNAGLVLKVNSPTFAEARDLPIGCVLISQINAFLHLDVIEVLRERQITTLAMDQVPRITRAQPMDVLSSQATVTGYKAALLAAELSPRLFPMLTTAAGTIRPSRVIVIGAGVAGLQAIATARRLGAQVEAYDIRRAAREQIESLGARMIDTGVEAEGPGGYARALNKEEKQKQHDVLAERLSQAHAVICTAAIPGRRAPQIITLDMVEGMMPDTVIVDAAAETGGNCELTRPGEHYMHGDVLIAGPINLPSSGAVHASEMYARNIFSMLNLLLQDGQLHLNWEDEIISACLLTHQGEIYHAATAELLGLECAAPLSKSQLRSDSSPDHAAGWISEDETKPDSIDQTELASGVVDVAMEVDAGQEFLQSKTNPLPDVDSAIISESPSSALSTEDEPPRQDLTLIEGIGPALQNRLYAYGVTRFAHLAALDAEAVHNLEIQLELDGEIVDNHWVTQAARLEDTN